MKGGINMKCMKMKRTHEKVQEKESQSKEMENKWRLRNKEQSQRMVCISHFMVYLVYERCSINVLDIVIICTYVFMCACV